MEKKRKGLTLGVNKEGVNIEMFEGKPRYLTLSDGQVFDRTYRPEPNKHLPGMIAANDSYSGIIRQDAGILNALTNPIKRKKLGKITQNLKDFNVLKEVRYGVSGPMFDIVGEMLGVTEA